MQSTPRGSSRPQFYSHSASFEISRERDYHETYTRLEATDTESSDVDEDGQLESLEVVETADGQWKRQTRGAFFVRGVALLCACSLSIGSHYAAHILGPLKSELHRQLGTSHTEFGLLLSVYGLNSTWTPLVGGILASRLGTTSMSIISTSIILIGQVLLLLGDTWGNVRIMALGLFVFGLGVSPVSVVQETIIVRFFKSHGLGVSMAMGLIAGKGASFLSARTAYPLSEHFGPRAPFYVSTALAGFSVLVNLIYIGLSRFLIDTAGAELEAVDISSEARRRSAINDVTESRALEEVVKKRRVRIHQIAHLGDVFWAYIGLNIFCGMIWSPFTQLSANIIQIRYNMSEEVSTDTASYLLFGPILLYPLCGYIVDKRKHTPIITQLLLLSSGLTLLAYAWLALPPLWTRTPFLSIFSFAIGIGFSPLLLVVMVPSIVPSEYISTALGAHKCMEQTGSILVQTLSGMLLDIKAQERKAASFQYLLDSFVVLNVLQGGSIWLFSYLQRRKDKDQRGILSYPDSFETELTDGESHRLSEISTEAQTPLLSSTPDTSSTFAGPLAREQKEAEIRRGRTIAFACLALVVFAWVLVMAVGWEELGKERKK